MAEITIQNVEERLRELELQVVEMSVVLRDVHSSVSKPTNWSAWAGSVLTGVGMIGIVIYAAYIKPLETRIETLNNRIQSLEDEMILFIVDNYPPNSDGEGN